MEQNIIFKGDPYCGVLTFEQCFELILSIPIHETFSPITPYFLF